MPQRAANSSGTAYVADEPGVSRPAARLTVEAIARRLAELLIDELCEPRRLVDTPAVARMLSTSEEWVRDHAAELGAIRIGDGPKGALRFEERRVHAALEHRRIGRPQQRQAGRPGPRRRPAGVLPVAVPENVRDW